METKTPNRLILAKLLNRLRNEASDFSIMLDDRTMKEVNIKTKNGTEIHATGAEEDGSSVLFNGKEYILIARYSDSFKVKAHCGCETYTEWAEKTDLIELAQELFD